MSGDYFRTMQIRLLRGRVFTDEEASATTVRPVIVSSALARRFWREGDELGRRITDDRNTFEIVGVADDATAAWANPAGLTILNKKEVSFEARGWNFTQSHP